MNYFQVFVNLHHIKHNKFFYHLYNYIKEGLDIYYCLYYNYMELEQFFLNYNMLIKHCIIKLIQNYI